MKQLFLIFSMFFCVYSKAQFTGTSSSSNPTTLTQFKGGVNALVATLITQYDDTTTANTTPAKYYGGSQIFTTSDGNMWYRNANVTAWIKVGTGSVIGNSWLTTGNHITAPYSFTVGNYIGTNNNYPLYLAWDSSQIGSLTDSAIKIGVGATRSLGTIGMGNTFIGNFTGGHYGTYNTALGTNAGNGLGTSSGYNVAVGYQAFDYAGVGQSTYCTALGYFATVDNLGPYTHSVALGAGATVTANDQLTIDPNITTFNSNITGYANAGYVLTTDGVGNATFQPATGGGGGVSSVGLSMPPAFSVANSPVTSSGTLAVTGAGTTSQYIDGTGALQTFPTQLWQYPVTEVSVDYLAPSTLSYPLYVQGNTYLYKNVGIQAAPNSAYAINLFSDLQNSGETNALYDYVQARVPNSIANKIIMYSNATASGNSNSTAFSIVSLGNAGSSNENLIGIHAEAQLNQGNNPTTLIGGDFAVGQTGSIAGASVTSAYSLVGHGAPMSSNQIGTFAQLYLPADGNSGSVTGGNYGVLQSDANVTNFFAGGITATGLSSGTPVSYLALNSSNQVITASGGGGLVWSPAGNAGTGGTGVLGTTDDNPFGFVVNNHHLGEFFTTGAINLGDGHAAFGTGNSGLSTNGTNLTTVGDWNKNLNATVLQIDDNATTIFLGSLNNSTSNFTINNSTGVLQYFSNDPYMLLDGINRRFQFGDFTYDWYGTAIDVNDGYSNQSIAVKANNKITLTSASGGATLVGIGTTTPQATLNVVGTPQFDVNLSDYPQGHNFYMTDSSTYVYEADGDWKNDESGTFDVLSDSAQTISWNQHGGYLVVGGTSIIYNYGAAFPFLGFYNNPRNAFNPQDLRWYGTSTTNYSGLHGILSPTQVYDATIPAAYAINGVWKDVAGNGVLVENISFQASFSATETAVTTVTVTLPQTMPANTYTVGLTPTSLLGATPFYVTNKTTTTFDVVYSTAVTGSLTFDYSISQ